MRLAGPAGWLRLAVAACAASAASALALPPGTSWTLQLPAQGPVAYHGIASFDGAGAAGHAMLYPAPHLGGFIAAVITHGVLVEAQKSAQKQKLQESADAGVAQFRERMAGFEYRELMARALERVEWQGPKALAEPGPRPAGWVLRSTPTLRVSDGGAALVLDNSIAVFAPGEADKPAHSIAVRVVSRPLKLAEVDAFWAAEGAAARAESSNMLAHSLRLALGQLAGAATAAEAPQRTLRYREGLQERIERAQPLQDHCERRVVRTLRGELLSVPVEPAAEAAAPCEEALAGWK